MKITYDKLQEKIFWHLIRIKFQNYHIWIAFILPTVQPNAFKCGNIVFAYIFVQQRNAKLHNKSPMFLQ